jgi:molybdenum cofactor cytidylyltransferase
LRIVGILLAAGSATRFGSDKLSHRLPHGVTIAAQAARHLHAVIPEIFAAVRPGSDALAGSLSEYCKVVVCENAAQGMGASLACGVRAAGPADGYVIALADMPFARSTSIAAVRDALAAGAPLAAPYFRARRGHPVGIGAVFHDQLIAARGDEGARRLIAENESRLVKIPVGDPGVIRDIDRPDDLEPPLKV